MTLKKNEIHNWMLMLYCHWKDVFDAAGVDSFFLLLVMLEKTFHFDYCMNDDYT